MKNAMFCLSLDSDLPDLYTTLNRYYLNSTKFQNIGMDEPLYINRLGLDQYIGLFLYCQYKKRPIYWSSLGHLRLHVQNQGIIVI